MAVRAEGVLVKVNVVGVESQLSAAVRAGVGNQVVVGIFLLGGIILIVCVVRAVLAVAFVRIIGIFVVLFLVAEERFRQVGQIIVDGLNVVLQLPVRLVHALHFLRHVAHRAEDFQQQLVAVLLHVELHARRKALQVAHFVRQFAHVQPS